MEERYVIKKKTKIFMENDKLYLFDIPACVKAAAEFSPAQLGRMCEQNIENDSVCKGRSMYRLFHFLEGRKTKNGKEESIGINSIKLLGLTLKNNEMAFLREISVDKLADVIEKKECEETVSDLKKVYEKLYEVLYEYVDSQCYNFIPGTQEEAGSFYERKLDRIQRDVEVKFINHPEMCEKLKDIVRDIRYFTKRFEIPGVLGERWGHLHKPLTFFDCVYDFLEDGELFCRISMGKVFIDENTACRFSFIPTYQDVWEQKKYWKRILMQNDEGNLQYSYEKIFRNELLIALRKVFQHNFSTLFQDM